jgi:hypothetical protein
LEARRGLGRSSGDGCLVGRPRELRHLSRRIGASLLDRADALERQLARADPDLAELGRTTLASLRAAAKDQVAVAAQYRALAEACRRTGGDTAKRPVEIADNAWPPAS